MPDARTERLGEVRRRHAEASTDWQYHFGHDGETMTARVIPAEEPYTVFTLSKQCTYPDREFASNIHADQAFLLELLDDTFSVVRQLRQALERRQPKPKDYAAECAMKCADANFQHWMSEVHGLDNAHDKMRVAARVRSMLQIESRTQLNTDQAAATRWRRMVEDADSWTRRRGR